MSLFIRDDNQKQLRCDKAGRLWIRSDSITTGCWDNQAVTKLPTPTELIRFARQRVGYKATDEIDYLDEMPLNATGKVDRLSLKNWLRRDMSLSSILNA